MTTIFRPRRSYYYPYFYPNYYRQPADKRFYAAEGEGIREEVVKSIAAIIVDNRKELIEKLDEFKIACSCGLHDATEADLSDIIVENLGNEKLRMWLAMRTAEKFSKSSVEGGVDPVTLALKALGDIFKATGSIVGGAQQNKAIKGQYKNLITNEALKYKAEQERAKQRERTLNTVLAAGASLALLGIGALIYFSSTKRANVTATA